MLAEFEAYRTAQAEINDLTELSGAVVAIEAGFFLKRLLEKEGGLPYEDLVPATGGIPYHLRSFIEDDLDSFKNAGVEVVFVFDGLNAGKRFLPFRESSRAVDKCIKAWDKYEAHNSQEAKDIFRGTGALTVESSYGLLQTILKERNISFKVAPYKAVAQIAYLHQHGNDYVDAVAGPYDLLLYDVNRVIINLNMQQDRFSFIDRSEWMSSLAVQSSDQFIDACLLSGTSFCRPIPLKPERKIPDLLHMLRGNGDTGYSLCRNMEQDPNIIESQYLDRFRRARLRVKHSVVLTTDGKVEPMDSDNVPRDLHEIVGQHLPDEIYYYLSLGAIGTRLLNDISCQEIYEQVPLDGGISEEYKTLVSEKLMPIKQMSIALLTKWMHRAFQYREYEYRFWYDESKRVSFKPAEFGDPGIKVKTWKVSKESLQSSSEYSTLKAVKPSLAFAIRSLAHKSFVKRTLEDQKLKGLLDNSTVEPNILWRFLHLRDYTTDEHELTSWGKVLSTIISSFGPDVTPELQDAALLATEMLRLNLFTSSEYWPTYHRPTEEGVWQDKVNRTLISRVVSLGHLSHDSTGYSGRLSRRLLGYNRMITAVQNSLRDLLEACFASILLNGDADRDGSLDLTAVGQGLPLNTPINAALGIAVHHYLEQLDIGPPDSAVSGADQTTAAKPKGKDADKEGAKDPEKQKVWKHHLKTIREPSFLANATDVEGDLEKAWSIWDAVFEGVKMAQSLGLVQKKMVDEWKVVDEWLAPRR